MHVNQITGTIIDAAMKVHSTLGPGLLESAYRACLMHELRKRGLAVVHEVRMPLIYDSLKMGVGYRVDLLVENTVIVELKRSKQ